MSRKTWHGRISLRCSVLHRSWWCHGLLLFAVLLLASAELFHAALHHHCLAGDRGHAVAAELRTPEPVGRSGAAVIRSGEDSGNGCFENLYCPLCNGAFVCTGYTSPEFTLVAVTGTGEFREPEQLHILKLSAPWGRAPPLS